MIKAEMDRRQLGIGTLRDGGVLGLYSLQSSNEWRTGLWSMRRINISRRKWAHQIISRIVQFQDRNKREQEQVAILAMTM